MFVAVSRQARRAIAALELPGRLATTIFYQLKGENIMTINIKTVSSGLAAIVLTASAHTVLASGGNKPAQNYCMDVEIEPFHMMPDGSCAVRDFWDGELQEAFYPFTMEDHLFNCEYFGEGNPVPLPTGELVPSSVVSEGNIEGTIGGHPFEATLLCASLTNWYQDSCADPENPDTCTFQLAQPVIGLKAMLFEEYGIEIDTYPRVTEVSLFDGVITIEKGNKTLDIPIVMATRAAGITHLEDLSTMPPEVGASITHSLLGMVTYEVDEDDKGDRDYKVLDGSVDLLLQGHIFSPVPVEEDPGAAVVRGSICSKDLYKQLNHKGGHGKSD
jgi:hypothetical protein